MDYCDQLVMRLIVILLIVLLTHHAVARTPKHHHREDRCTGAYAGTASWYGMKFHGKIMANGLPFNALGISAASRTIPLGTLVRVTNMVNKREVLVRISDRGPYINCRVIDLSLGAARVLGIEIQGLAQVKLEIIKE
jgi:rare lipoprotein A